MTVDVLTPTASIKSKYSLILEAISSYFLPSLLAFTNPIFHEFTLRKLAKPPCAKDLSRFKVEADWEYALNSLAGFGSLFSSENSIPLIESP